MLIYLFRYIPISFSSLNIVIKEHQLFLSTLKKSIYSEQIYNILVKPDNVTGNKGVYVWQKAGSMTK